jgi:hypothetical protein
MKCVEAWSPAFISLIFFLPVIFFLARCILAEYVFTTKIYPPMAWREDHQERKPGVPGALLRWVNLGERNITFLEFQIETDRNIFKIFSGFGSMGVS